MTTIIFLLAFAALFIVLGAIGYLGLWLMGLAPDGEHHFQEGDKP